MRTVIFVNGEINNPEQVKAILRENDRIICADGGTRHALALGLTPHAVVGDLDSLEPGQRRQLEAIGCRMIVYPRRKDETDLELALSYAITTGADEILILGALGDRLDQTLANLLLLARPEWSAAQLVLADGHQKATVVRRHLAIQGAVGETISLIPLSPIVTGITTQGLEWTLRDDELRFGSTRGISNVMTAPEAHVWVGAGVLLVIQMRISESASQRRTDE